MMGSKINSSRQNEGWARHTILFISCFKVLFGTAVRRHVPSSFLLSTRTVGRELLFFLSFISSYLRPSHSLGTGISSHSAIFFFTASLVSLVAVKTDIKTFRSGMKRFNQCKQNGGHLSPVAGDGRRCGRPGAAN